ncbi:MAG: hypothetical protein LBV72_05690 [Tannerella sp.]|jgi:hypothetical protein|nr:hypothetical protein [Tannerella sp.]
MKHLLINILIAIQLTGYSAGKVWAEQNEPVSNIQTKNTSQTDTISANRLFQEKSTSSFEIIPGNKNMGFEYKTIDISYKHAFLLLPGQDSFNNYFARYTITTNTCTACEGQERNIKVLLRPFEDPEKTALTIDQNCDQLDLYFHNYQTIKYGCCGAENELEIFDYNNQSIIQADNQIIIGYAPNSEIKLYIGSQQAINDSLDISTLMISYNSTEKYIIRIKSKIELESHCSPFSPDIEIYEKGENILSETRNEYPLWSLNGINNKAQINDLVIRLKFDCDETVSNHIIDIPIIQGKPFGKENKEQDIYL